MVVMVQYTAVAQECPPPSCAISSVNTTEYSATISAPTARITAPGLDRRRLNGRRSECGRSDVDRRIVHLSTNARAPLTGRGCGTAPGSSRRTVAEAHGAVLSG